MEYRLLDTRTGAPLDMLELHVLARAYYAAWRVVHGPEPKGLHPVAALHALIDYEPSFKGPGRD